MLGVLGVGLDPVAGRPLQLRRRRYHAPDVVVGQNPGQPVAGRSGLVHQRDRAGPRRQPTTTCERGPGPRVRAPPYRLKAGIEGEGNGVRSSVRLWAGLLGLAKVVVEDVEFDELREALPRL